MVNQEDKKLEKIPKPKAGSTKPDRHTLKALSEDDVKEIANVILVSIGSIGVILFIIGLGIHCCIGVDPGVEFRFSAIQQLTVGLGIELLASSAIIYSLRNKSSSSKVVFWFTVGGLVGGVALMCVPMIEDLRGVAEYMIAFGVEVFGAALIFGLFDNVIEKTSR